MSKPEDLERGIQKCRQIIEGSEDKIAKGKVLIHEYEDGLGRLGRGRGIFEECMLHEWGQAENLTRSGASFPFAQSIAGRLKEMLTGDRSRIVDDCFDAMVRKNRRAIADQEDELEHEQRKINHYQDHLDTLRRELRIVREEQHYEERTAKPCSEQEKEES